MTINSAPMADPRPVPDHELKARIRGELARGFTRPPALLPVVRPLQDLSAVMDLGKLAAMAAAASNGMELGFALISKEYIQTGLNWINAMHRIGFNNFIVIAGDEFSSKQMEERGIHSVRAIIDEDKFDASFMSHDGFSAKGLAMIAFKFPVARFLVNSGYSVVLSDADAIWLRDPMPFMRGTDVAFQRIDYHPPSIAKLWGFAACTGFVFFRHDTRTIAFLDRCIEEHQLFHCDQVAMNVALLEDDPDWYCDHASWLPPGSVVHHDRANMRAAFAKLVKSPISGVLRRSGLQLLALPHDKFWRHRWVPSSLSDMVICHPNSPKADLEKQKTFEALGVRFLTG